MQPNLRDMFKSKSPDVLGLKIDTTLILGSVRVRVRCYFCHSEEVASSPTHWRSLIGLTGECFKCGGYVLIETAFLDADRKEIAVASPELSQQQLLALLCRVAEYGPPASASAAHSTSPAGGGTLQPDASGTAPSVGRAIMAGATADLARLLSAHNINNIVERGMTPLFFACYHGKEEIARWLLERKADVNAKSKDGMRAIHGATSSKSAELTQLLIAAKASVNDVDSNGFSPLHNACMEGQLDMCRLLLAKAADVNFVTMTKATPLHLAARSGVRDVVALLLAARAPVDAEDVFGRTPLANAIYFGKEPAGRALLEGGASVLNVKTDLPIPSWAGGEAGRLIASKDSVIQQLQTQLEQARLTGTASEQRVRALEQTKEKQLQDAAAHASDQEERVSRAQAEAAKWQALYEETREHVVRLERDNAALRAVVQQHEDAAIQRTQQEACFAWTDAEKTLGVAAPAHDDEVRAAKERWLAAVQALRAVDDRLQGSNVPMVELAALAKQRNERREALVALGSNVVQAAHQHVKAFGALSQKVAPFAREPVDGAKATYQLRHEQSLMAQRDEFGAFTSWQASLKLQELSSKRDEEVQWAGQLELELVEQQKLVAVQDQALALLHEVVSVARHYLRARTALQHAQHIASDSNLAESADLETLTRCKAAFAAARVAYEEKAAHSRMWIRRGFAEFKHCAGEASESVHASLEEFVVVEQQQQQQQPQQDAVLKAVRGGAPYALKRRAKHLVELEYHVLKRLHHPYVLAAEAMFVDSPTTAVLVLPWIDGGTLQHWLQSTKPTQDVLRDVFRCILLGLSHIHSCGVVHGDLCLQNVLMESDGQPRICDFDRSRDVTYVSVADDSAAPSTLDASALEYCSPELLQSPPAAKSSASDVYALGMCFWRALLPAQRCYMRAGDAHPTVPANRVPGLSHLLEWTMKRDAAKRPPVIDVLLYPFFTAKPDALQQPQSRLEAFRASIKLVLAQARGFEGGATDDDDDCECVLVKIRASAMLHDVADALWTTHSMLCVRFDVQFEGEDGIDAGALTAAMYTRFLRAACAATQLFEAGPQGKCLPRACTALDDEALLLYRAVGLALARTLVDERAVDAPCASVLFKFLQQDGGCDMSDLEEFDHQRSQAMMQLLSPVGDCSLYGFDEVGEPAQDVTRQNKQLFVRKYIEWTLVGSRRAALLALREGFHALGDAVNRHLRILTWRDVKLLLSGVETLEPAAVLQRLHFEGFATDSATPQHLRQLLQELGSEALKRFVSFATAQESLPVAGTARPIRVRCVAADGGGRLPVSHACFWLLDLPDYRDLETLRRQLARALEEDGGAFTAQ